MRPTKLFAVACVHTSTVDDTGLLCNNGRDSLREEDADIRMGFLRLCRSRDFARSDRPHWLVGNHNLAEKNHDDHKLESLNDTDKKTQHTSSPRA